MLPSGQKEVGWKWSPVTGGKVKLGVTPGRIVKENREAANQLITVEAAYLRGTPMPARALGEEKRVVLPCSSLLRNAQSMTVCHVNFLGQHVFCYLFKGLVWNLWECSAYTKYYIHFPNAKFGVFFVLTPFIEFWKIVSVWVLYPEGLFVKYSFYVRPGSILISEVNLKGRKTLAGRWLGLHFANYSFLEPLVQLLDFLWGVV